MKYLLAILTPLLLSFSMNACGQNFSQQSKLKIYHSHFDSEFKGWTRSFKTFRLSSFKKAGTFAFENIPYMDLTELKEFYSIYKPALSYSSDKSQFIDIYSYWLVLDREGKAIVSRGGEPEQAITLCNFKTKTWTRILFRGTTERILDVLWLTNSTFLLVGSRENESGQQCPVIYIGDTITKTFESFVSTDNGSVQKKRGYTSPKLLRLKIQER